MIALAYHSLGTLCMCTAETDTHAGGEHSFIILRSFYLFVCVVVLWPNGLGHVQPVTEPAHNDPGQA